MMGRIYDWILLNSKKSGHHIFDRQNTSRFLAKFLNVKKSTWYIRRKIKEIRSCKFFDPKNNFLTQDFPVVSFTRFLPYHHTLRATRERL